MILAIGVSVGFLLTWNFKPSQIDVIEKFIDREVIIEVTPPNNCQAVDMPSKFEKASELGMAYARVKAAYTHCLNSLN